MKTAIFLLCLFSPVVFAKAQTTIFVENTNFSKPAYIINYEVEEGSPYLYDWAEGEAVLSDGKKYKDLELKYDQVADKVMFRYDRGDAMNFELAIREFSIFYVDKRLACTSRFMSGFAPVDGATGQSFYEVMSAGKEMLLKRTVKTVISSKEYGSSTTTKKIFTNVAYYIGSPGTGIAPVKLKRDKRSIMELFPKKAAELETFMKSNHTDLKKDQDLRDLIAFATAS
ncbi:hypothetical protein [Hufsiella ginkgonis]|uniref:GLPGLI family protein n=1 Tax=Hufsiella ginkgonis TaxID=2695274 RepID=A0A7K1Y116_9SPHI|nr:hypothetical protein [Hufsiella ginkgonis]MXV16933.1 hypothetical protein [Hufsiella ginkgonis]